MLQVRNLHVNYGKIRAVRDVSLRVGQGEIVSLIGANGAGKTTTLMAISGLIKASSGSVQFRGQEITGKAPGKIVAGGIVQVPEGRQVFSRLTVEENLKMGGFTVRDKQRIRQRMEWVQELFPILRQRRDQKAGSLSGGEQQMLAIGRALICGADLLLLDEPSLGLAPIMVQQVFQVLQQLRREGISILLIEQNASDAMAISQRTYIMETGEIAMQGESRELIADPKIASVYLGGEVQ
ncbi:MAG: ABC transporter ATP-binding protein [Firmicutes bacterium]|nr:ABC transporter ATP-binding protein [Bacillota bacterium]